MLGWCMLCSDFPFLMDLTHEKSLWSLVDGLSMSLIPILQKSESIFSTEGIQVVQTISPPHRIGNIAFPVYEHSFVDDYVSDQLCKYPFYKKKEMGSSHPLSCSFKICLWRTFRRRQGHKGGWNLFSLWLACSSSVPSFNIISRLSHLKIPHKHTVSGGPGAYSAPGRAFSCLSLTTSRLFCVTRWKMSITDVLSADDIAAALQECQGKEHWGQGWLFPSCSHLLQSLKD